MLVDILIVILAASSLYRGRDLGFVRQLCSTVGFFGGLFIGALIEPHLAGLAHSEAGKSLITLLVTLGSAFILLTAGEYAGLHLKQKVRFKRINSYDNALGSVLGVVSILFSVWLLASIVSALPAASAQSAVRDSRIIRGLDRILPAAPTVIADLGKLIDPNGFPQVFIGSEPIPRDNVSLPNLGELQAAVEKDRLSVVKIQGVGCGGVVEGSGFVVGSDYVATNAHVVAGIKKPFVQDANGTHSGTVVLFDPNLDFAVLRVSNLAGNALNVSTAKVKSGAAAAVLGYPGNGNFTADPAAVLDQFTASGRNIYGKGSTSRDIYEVQSNIIPGNSGGPLVAPDGSVIGVVFAESTAYQHVGYTLTTSQVKSEIAQAMSTDMQVGTGSCAE